MGNMYRILIESGDGEVVADLTAPVETLAQFAPEAVARLLREAVPEVEGDTPEAPKFADAQPVKRRRRTKAEMDTARAAGQHPAPEVHTDPIPAEVVPDVPVEKAAAYNPFG